MLSRDQEENIIKNQRVETAVGAVEAFDIGAIFVTFLKDIFHTFLEEIGKYFMFPIAAMGAAIKAILAWRQVNLEKGEKSSTIVRATIETATAAAITVAVIGSLVAASIFATLAPIIFVAALAVKSAYHLFSSIYYGIRAAFEDEPQKKQEYKNAAYANAVGFVASALTTIAVGFVMIIGKPAIAIAGIISAVIGVGYAIYKLCTEPTPSEAQPAYVPLPAEAQTEKEKPNSAPGAGLAPTPSIQAQLTAATAAPVTPAVAPATPAAPPVITQTSVTGEPSTVVTSNTEKPAVTLTVKDQSITRVEKFSTENKLGDLLRKRGMYAQPVEVPIVRAHAERPRVAAAAA